MTHYQVYKHSGNVHDGRYLTRNSDGSARWTLTRGDANFYTKAEAKKVAAHYNRVFIGHTLMVVPEGTSPWEGKPESYGWNPNGRKSAIPKSVRDLALAHKVNLGRDEHGNYYIVDPTTKKWAAHTASAKPSAAMAKAMIRKYVRGRKTNPAAKYSSYGGMFQIATMTKGGTLQFFNGEKFTRDRRDAVYLRSQDSARKVAESMNSSQRLAVCKSDTPAARILEYFKGKQ